MSASSRVVVASAGAATTIVVARLLGPAAAGGYFLAQSLVLVLLVATTFGMEHGITYFVTTGAWAPRDAYASAWRLATVLGLVGAALAVAIRVLVPSAFAGLTIGLTVIIVLALPFGLLALYAGSIAVATDDYETYALLPGAQAVLVLVLSGTGAAALGLKGAVIGMTLAGGLVGAGVAIWARRLRQDANAAHTALRRAASFGIKGYAGNALQILNYRLDLFVLSVVASRASVGQYSIAVAATSLLWLLPNAISDVLLPRVAHLTGRDHAAGRDIVELKSLRHASLILALTAVGLVAVLETLVVPIYGSGFRPAVNLGLILLPGAVLVPLGRLLAAMIVGRGKPAYPLYGALLTTPTTVVLYVALIPRLHATGAALASTLSYTSSFLVLWFFYRRMTDRPLLASLTPTRSEINDLAELARQVVGSRKVT